MRMRNKNVLLLTVLVWHRVDRRGIGAEISRR
jgi:hypothetical protein